jgi:peptide/nickel transport system ATP-binding protein
LSSTPTSPPLRDPAHPYTEGLLAAIPVLGEVRETLAVIPGSVPNLINLPPGCKFHPRCPYAKEICVGETPQLEEVEPGHKVRCYMRFPRPNTSGAEWQRGRLALLRR